MYEVNCSNTVIFYGGYYLHCQCILSIQGRNYRIFGVRQSQLVGIICSPGWDRVKAFENLGKGSCLPCLTNGYAPVNFPSRRAPILCKHTCIHIAIKKMIVRLHIHIKKNVLLQGGRYFLHWKKIAFLLSLLKIFSLWQRIQYFLLWKKTRSSFFSLCVSTFKELRIISFSVNNMTEKSRSFLGF